jgi:hypothetical protein
MKNTTLLPLVIASLLLVAAAPERTYMGHRVVDRDFTIAGGETVSLPVTDAGPIPAENPAFKIEVAGVSIQKSIAGPKLAWKFALTAKTAKTLEHVLVEEVHPSEVAKVLVDDPSPSLQDKIWSSATAGIEPNPGTTAWLFTEEASVFVFRFTITPAGGPSVVLYQPAWFAPPQKEAFRQAIAQIGSQPAPAPAPLPGPLKKTEEVPGVSLVRHAAALRKDTLRDLALFAKKEHKCGSVSVIDTKHERSDGEVLVDRKGRLFSGVVSERWSVEMCGELRALALVFRSDGKGASQISIAEVESDK